MKIFLLNVHVLNFNSALERLEKKKNPCRNKYRALSLQSSDSMTGCLENRVEIFNTQIVKRTGNLFFVKCDMVNI